MPLSKLHLQSTLIRVPICLIRASRWPKLDWQTLTCDGNSIGRSESPPWHGHKVQGIPFSEISGTSRQIGPWNGRQKCSSFVFTGRQECSSFVLAMSLCLVHDTSAQFLCKNQMQDSCNRLLCPSKDSGSRLLTRQKCSALALRSKSEVFIWFLSQVGIGSSQSRDIEAGTALPAVDCLTSSLGDSSRDHLRMLVAENGVFGRATPPDKLQLLGSL